jgi:hypothetical protein
VSNKREERSSQLIRGGSLKFAILRKEYSKQQTEINGFSLWFGASGELLYGNKRSVYITE